MADRAALLLEKETHLKTARDIAAKADTEGRDFTAEERVQVTAAVEAARKSHSSILEIDGDAKLLDDLNSLGRPIGELAKGGGSQAGKGVSSGERFTESPEFKSWLESQGPTGRIPESAKGLHSPPVAFKGLKDILAGGSVTSAGALVAPDILGLQDTGPFMRPLVLRQLVTNGTTGSDTVEYARVTGFTNNAAPVAEAAGVEPFVAGAGQVQGEKPQTSMTLEKVITSVKTVAHWIPATKRALSDAAQIRTLIDMFLRYGLEEELENQIIAGNNTGENFDGILNVSGVQAQAFDTDILTTLRKAKTKVRIVGRTTPTAYVLNPEDNEKIDLLKDTVGRFYGNGPFGVGPDVLWGLPRIESEAVAAGEPIVANWRMAVLWDREQAAIQISDSHADFFIRNLVAILAEMRAAFGIIRPKAFVVAALA
jgi:HK97 family phage major capsid protein